jgi:putative membrane protein
MTSERSTTDTGLQAERTALAWRRSAISLLGASAVLARLTYELDHVSAISVAIAGTTVAFSLDWMVRMRLMHFAEAIRSGDLREPAARRLPLLIAAVSITAIGALSAMTTFVR